MIAVEKVMIFGSCVSRDAFEYADPKYFEVVGYYARSSLASLVSTPFVDVDILKNIKSSWQRRSVKADMDKSFWKMLDSTEFDVLLLDLVDERFQLLQKANGAIHTVSAEYKKASNGRLDGKLISRNGERKFELWFQGFTRLVDNLEKTGNLHKLKVNKVFWSTQTDKGGDVPGFPLAIIEQANGSLQRMYTAIEGYIPNVRVLRYPEHLFRASDNHKWGASPFHYNEALYKSTIKQLVHSTNEKQDIASEASRREVL